MDTVIGPHTPIANTHQGKVWENCMLRTIINGDTTRGRGRTQAFNFAFFFAKIIQCQGTRFVDNKIKNLIQRLIGFDLQH